ncbi:hypothetical protein ACH5RR_040404 [Cinchona calisaya]|uniref:Uncharacterized protein n=1 Tax=Cinchona calisaya TaxID=153742 RepID=A0ABD2XVT7_9GENT
MIHNFYDDNSQGSYCFDHPPSLITFGSTKPLPAQTLLPEHLSSKLLEVLDLRSTLLEEIPNEIFNLFYLKVGGFLKLQELCLENLKRLRWIRVEEDAMPHLQEVILDEIPLL